MGMMIGDVGLTPKGYFQVSVNAAVLLETALATVVPPGARFVWINPESGSIRFRDDGVNPTTTIGYLLDAGVHWPCGIVDLRELRLIGVAGATTVNLTFYG